MIPEPAAPGIPEPAAGGRGLGTRPRPPAEKVGIKPPAAPHYKCGRHAEVMPMADGTAGEDLSYRLNTLAHLGVVRDLSDVQLLLRFLGDQPAAAEAAFAALGASAE